MQYYKQHPFGALKNLHFYWFYHTVPECLIALEVDQKIFCTFITHPVDDVFFKSKKFCDFFFFVLYHVHLVWKLF